ncbi:hypothetical protein D3C72_1837550 [compost metagenome]
MVLVRQRLFCVGDPPSGRHQVDLTRANDLDVAQTVAVQHLALDHPGEGLQANMRMGTDAQAGFFFKHRRAGMIEKTPRADHSSLARGHQSVDGNPATHFGGARSDSLNRFNALFHRTIQGRGQLTLGLLIAHRYLSYREAPCLMIQT